ncbi:MAG TPA: archease [Candidatus Binatia bacterium]|jgi:tRNA nucleotidyltransferase (CCA-adding enzyme)
MGCWELFPHGADVGVRGIGHSKPEAFEQAAIALTAVITDPITVTAKDWIDVLCEASDDELLLVNWLNALIYEMATRKMLFAHFEVYIDGKILEAKAWGEAMDPDKHELAIEVKGATCTALSVKQDDSGNWIAQCVVDV